MQGSFNVDWDEKLDPYSNASEETFRAQNPKKKTSGNDKRDSSDSDEPILSSDDDSPAPPILPASTSTNLTYLGRDYGNEHTVSIPDDHVPHDAARFFSLQDPEQAQRILARVTNFTSHQPFQPCISGFYISPFLVTDRKTVVPFPDVPAVPWPKSNEEYKRIYRGMPGFPIQGSPPLIPSARLQKDGNKEYIDVGDWGSVDLGDISDIHALPPDRRYCIQGEHFIAIDPSQNEAYEVDFLFLKKNMQEAEALDFEFAKIMQGFSGASLQSVWDCLDPSFNPSDRKEVMDQFLAMYIRSFYDDVRWSGNPYATDVAAEAMSMHKTACSEWVHKHYRTLTNPITTAATMVVGEFFQTLGGRINTPNLKFSQAKVATFFMRSGIIRSEFASCVHAYMSVLDQARGNRNPSYKQMSASNMHKYQTFRRFAAILELKMPAIVKQFQSLSSLQSYHFDPLLVDWHGIAGQLPDVHRHFAFQVERLFNDAAKRPRRGVGQGGIFGNRRPWSGRR